MIEPQDFWEVIQQRDECKAEIERLWKELNKRQKQGIEQRKLITDLVDELDFWEQSEGFLWGEPELKQRAREATK